MSEPNAELKNIIEAALLVAGQPLTIDKLVTMFPSESPPTREEIRAVLEMLEEEYAERVVELKQIDRAWRFQTREKYAPWITRLAEERPVRYSRALLETLAIIAYRQPVTRGDIEDIRGVSVSTDIIKTLIGREWIRQVGVRNVPGRPALYGTTREFLEHFNIKNLEELPPLSALRDLDVISNELNLRLDLEQGAESATAADAESHGGLEQESEPIMSEAKTAERE
ncbi:MAG: SMC-Scp complex subunit ScpB [Gammaproteobacteria bacterium]|nr:SMC-Scp complex subunit ScpB [Gammaproteobacteria bacterium]